MTRDRRGFVGSTVARLCLGVLLVPWAVEAADDERPICTIAAISSPYITTLSAEELGERSWLAASSPIGLRNAVAAVKSGKPDAFVVLGSLTWTGSDADFKKLKTFFADVDVPLHLVPGPKDLADGGLERFRRHFPKQPGERSSVRIRGVHLQLASPLSQPTPAQVTERVEWMEQDLKQAGDSRAVLMFGGLGYPATKPPAKPQPLQKRYWELVERAGVAARLIPSHSHYVAYENSLPIWSVPATGWSPRKWTVALIRVYSKRIELSVVRAADQPLQSLVIPNPVAAPRLPTAASDPYGVPTYSQDLALKPELTFVQLSDSQFDDKTVDRYKARFRYDQQMNKLAVTQVNRLKPAMVFMTGDLTNKNTLTEWKTFESIYSKLKPPFYTLPGNHDMSAAGTPDRIALYRRFTRREAYYSVEKNGCVFICLNTGTASVDREQMAWFRRELERTRSAKHVFVLGHYPVLAAFGNNVKGPEATEILTLLRQYKVAAYLSGHRHRYDYQVHDGVAHVLCDCLCWGEYLSYQVYHVFPDRIVACWKPIFRTDGNRPLYERVVFPEPRYRD